ncbi:MAG: GYF domain-containing protein [Bdellovibrionales bacterium]
MGVKWFVQSRELIDGPFSDEEVKARIASGELHSTGLVWTAGMEEWRNVAWFKAEANTMVRPADPISPSEIWHFAQGGKSHGPFNREKLIGELKHLGGVSDVLLWTKGMKEWAPLFEFHEILSAVGVNKRQFPRADLHGELHIHTNSGTIVAPSISISEGGMGAQLEDGLSPGESVNLEIRSPVFRDVLLVKAEVRYLSEGVLGLRFQNLSSENRNAIISYVRATMNRFTIKAA